MQHFIINHNGSKWYGEKPDPLEFLIERLKTYKIQDDTSWQKFGKGIRFFGNFENLSAGFSVDVYDAKLVTKLKGLIISNRARSKKGQLV